MKIYQTVTSGSSDKTAVALSLCVGCDAPLPTAAIKADCLSRSPAIAISEALDSVTNEERLQTVLDLFPAGGTRLQRFRRRRRWVCPSEEQGGGGGFGGSAEAKLSTVLEGSEVRAVRQFPGWFIHPFHGFFSVVK